MNVVAHPTQAVEWRPGIGVRPFRDGDYPRFVEIVNLSYPDDLWSEEEARHRDVTWDHSRYVKVRLMAEDDGGRIFGLGRINHVPDEYHPHKYYLDIVVDPTFRRRGAGATLYERLLAELRLRGAIAVRAGVHRETETESIGFLVRRGFVEAERGWQSRLHVPSFDVARFAGAAERTARQGIALTTLGAERARDPQALRKAYELTTATEQDAPSVDAVTETTFEYFLNHAVRSPKALPDAHFLAMDGHRYIGVSALYRPLAQPGVLQQDLTGVLREYRGKGIAMALKLQTVGYAREHGYHEIRTWNDARNRPMLRINEALGFVKQPAWIGYEKTLTSSGESA
ncbi:MAG: GNAT family N-acetyltransferase [Armatimonadota bacterium]